MLRSGVQCFHNLLQADQDLELPATVPQEATSIMMNMTDGLSHVLGNVAMIVDTRTPTVLPGTVVSDFVSFSNSKRFPWFWRKLPTFAVAPCPTYDPVGTDVPTYAHQFHRSGADTSPQAPRPKRHVKPTASQ
jgi:hypothetical protein